jgi:hypothetical protein
MEGFLKGMYPQVYSRTHNDYDSSSSKELVEGRFNAINARAYVLIGPKNRVASQKYWNKIVRPEWEVQLKFNNPELNTRPASWRRREIRSRREEEEEEVD